MAGAIDALALSVPMALLEDPVRDVLDVSDGSLRRAIKRQLHE